MNPTISIVISGARPELWSDLYSSIGNNEVSFELIFIGPDKLNYQFPNNVFFIQSRTKPVQCFEIGARLAQGKYLLFLADDTFFCTVKELASTSDILESLGLVRSKDFKLWMMVEVPSNIILMNKFLDVGIDGISIGSNDLTQLILGVDRDSPKLAEIFDERDEAVLWSLEKAISTTKKRRVTSSICGQAPSVYPELTTKLVKWGITSVSVNPDMIEQTRGIIAKAEDELGIRPTDT